MSLICDWSVFAEILDISCEIEIECTHKYFENDKKVNLGKSTQLVSNYVNQYTKLYENTMSDLWKCIDILKNERSIDAKSKGLFQNKMRNIKDEIGFGDTNVDVD